MRPTGAMDFDIFDIFSEFPEIMKFECIPWYPDESVLLIYREMLLNIAHLRNKLIRFRIVEVGSVTNSEIVCTFREFSFFVEDVQV